MDGREAMVASGGVSGPYYIQQHRGAFSGSHSATQSGLMQTPPGFRSSSNLNIPTQPNVGSTFAVEPKHVNFGHNMSVPSGVPLSDPVKKKRGRPRKYAPDGQVSLGLSPLPARPKRSPASDSQALKRSRGRPPGTGRKQQLATLGEWMNSSAGIAFAPHVISIGVGERPRVVCILSGRGTVSSVTLRQPATSVPTVTYEGRFEILCLSGSFLLAEDGGPRDRTGGVSASLSSPDGHVFGGGVAVLIAASPVQVVVCSFVYGGSKIKSKQVAAPENDKNSTPQPSNKSATQIYPPASQNFPPSAMNAWSGFRTADLRNPHPDIDLTRG
ncbi:at-hook motif nuclear-localized protein 12-related [Citrus sinensis]|uniref:At-hook motif nuclear-localized protein 12-related n=1 Tax=Citrus sinensis TaxID=2711 RepID=A0ACB8LQI4_CITSI|nr:at-hook motif nuclear-localized protein 12-related [Citrus sinensis]